MGFTARGPGALLSAHPTRPASAKPTAIVPDYLFEVDEHIYVITRASQQVTERGTALDGFYLRELSAAPKTEEFWMLTEECRLLEKNLTKKSTKGQGAGN